MAFLNETPTWTGIYQLEETDPLHGGEPNEQQGLGQLNWAPSHLANRTAWLRNQIEAVLVTIDNLTNGAPDALNTLSELAAALADSEDFAAGLTAQVALKLGADDFASQTEALAGAASDKIISPATMSAAISAALADLANGAPGALDTLNELAAALGDDADFAGTVTAALASKLNADQFTGPEVEGLLAGSGVSGLKRVCTPASGDDTTALHWCKIAAFDMTGPTSFSEASAHLRAYGQSRIASGVLEFLVHIRQSGSDDAYNARVDILAASASTIFAPNCLRLVEDTANGNLDLWIQTSDKYSKMEIYKVRASAIRDASIMYFDGAPWQAADPVVPAGGDVHISNGVGAFGVPVGVPVGTAIDVFGDTPPDGFLEMDRSVLGRAAYPRLWQYAQDRGVYDQTGANIYMFGPGDGLDTFQLPEGRGIMKRAWDHGRGFDAGRGLATFQSASAQVSLPVARNLNDSNAVDDIGERAARSDSTFAQELIEIGGPETRPANVSFMLCIKY